MHFGIKLMHDGLDYRAQICAVMLRVAKLGVRATKEVAEI